MRNLNHLDVLSSKLGNFPHNILAETTTKVINYIHQNENRKTIYQRDLHEEIEKGNLCV